jgi:hypothetical protein
MMQDRKASDSGYLVPGTWYLTPVSHSHISNLNRALLVTRHPSLVTRHSVTSSLRHSVTSIRPNLDDTKVHNGVKAPVQGYGL